MSIKQMIGKYQSGQAILLIVVSAVGLIAMMGLAIDGGRLLLLRRDTQNAADAAAIAAARALCTGDDPVAAATAAANQNGFNNDVVADTVVINHPPNPVPAGIGGDAGCEECFIEVRINGEIDASFIGIVYDGPLAATSNAIGACNPDMTANSGSGAGPGIRAVWSGSTQCNTTIDISGSTQKIDGGMHSNNDLKISGSSNEICGQTTYVEELQGSGSNNDYDPDWCTDDGGSSGSNDPVGIPDTSCLSTCFTSVDSGSGSSDSDPAESCTGNPCDINTPYAEDPLMHDINDYRPGGVEALKAVANGDVYLHYTWEQCDEKSQESLTSSWLKDNGYFNDTTKALKDGIYYSACGIDFSASDAQSIVTLVAEDDIDLSGSSHNLKWYTNNLLAFSNLNRNPSGGGNRCSNAVIKFAGSTHTWEGNLYAPYGNIEMSGSSNTTLKGCIVGDSVTLSGSNIELNCDTSSASGTNVIDPGMWLAQ